MLTSAGPRGVSLTVLFFLTTAESFFLAFLGTSGAEFFLAPPFLVLGLTGSFSSSAVAALASGSDF